MEQEAYEHDLREWRNATRDNGRDLNEEIHQD